MARTIHYIVILTAMAVSIGELWGCEMDQAHNGCKIISYTCTCGFGCKSEYRYSSKEECRNALKDRGNNICSRAPCLNKGTCIQITQDPGFKCRCENTGFYGNRCGRACPSAGSSGGIFPYECVVI